jgi:hypothetical protein
VLQLMQARRSAQAGTCRTSCAVGRSTRLRLNSRGACSLASPCLRRARAFPHGAPAARAQGCTVPVLHAAARRRRCGGSGLSLGSLAPFRVAASRRTGFGGWSPVAVAVSYLSYLASCSTRGCG